MQKNEERPRCADKSRSRIYGSEKHIDDANAMQKEHQIYILMKAALIQTSQDTMRAVQDIEMCHWYCPNKRTPAGIHRFVVRLSVLTV